MSYILSIYLTDVTRSSIKLVSSLATVMPSFSESRSIRQLFLEVVEVQR